MRERRASALTPIHCLGLHYRRLPDRNGQPHVQG